MSDHRLDSEIKLRTVVAFGVGLVLIMAVVTALMWWLSLGLRSHLAADDPPPAALPEARVQQLPPGPALQADPIAEIAAMHAEENEILETAAWVDEADGTVRLPIVDAVELVAVKGGVPSAESAEEPEDL